MIGPSITVRGDLTGEEDLQVEGRVEGKIDLKRNLVTVGAQGRVKADIYGRLIEVEGEVEGNLFGEEQIIVRRSGSVRGNITAPRVSLEDGANFKGTIDMDPKANQRKAEQAAQQAKAAGSHGGSAPGGPSRPNGPQSPQGPQVPSGNATSVGNPASAGNPAAAGKSASAVAGQKR